MIDLVQDTNTATISLAASLCNDPLAWSDGDDWLAEFCTWFHVMRDGELIGFLAWVDSDKGRIMHYGTTGASGLGVAMLKAWRMAARVACKEGAKLVAYIEPNQTYALRLARLVGFTRREGNFYEFK